MPYFSYEQFIQEGGNPKANFVPWLHAKYSKHIEGMESKLVTAEAQWNDLRLQLVQAEKDSQRIAELEGKQTALEVAVRNLTETNTRLENQLAEAGHPRKVEYEYDHRGNIILPSGAPFDGNPVLILASDGWVEARWYPSQRTETESGHEYDGFEWACLDDKFTAELDEAKFWMPVPALTKPACDCHKHERQVCDVCQGVTGREGKDQGCEKS